LEEDRSSDSRDPHEVDGATELDDEVGNENVAIDPKRFFLLVSSFVVSTDFVRSHVVLREGSLPVSSSSTRSCSYRKFVGSLSLVDLGVPVWREERGAERRSRLAISQEGVE